MGKNSSSINLMSQGSRQEIKTQAIILATFVAIFWLLEILDQFVFRGSLDIFGIIPHQVIGLRGILFAPFLHGDFPHLIANTVPFLILGWLVMLQETSDFFIVTGLTMLVGGLGVWLFATPGSIHIGASILIFGYLGFLLLRGYFQRNIPSILLSILVFLLYGGTIWGVLPSRPGISWQGHLFGFLGGVLAAKLIATEKKHYL
ncbi:MULTISPECIES: rhomboid family intramembrane serine protease [unclassified Microcystis]|jgi:membrane associated rhomboid family serine protease|uniref:Rhomboid family intramembrane serine protease n=1 Tax=Microcystis aeruginosa Ma_QC_Ca_00000000_S207 TaxID=2486251 RepID=A0A552F4A5_MICAE|nr:MULTISPECIES: rhomboid family intramembrane serine protease [unclassified Microcystis]MCA2925610.1 rhomboid family intramembrane serine protease [Microcystis sp. M020S1]MCA2934299.1 rhomboid family intramembrane serine protease [Microcystis sp. M015S1]NCR57238.1 rhomboid family intramembrane serine protease [Microcystis aeruginosa LL13-06]TRU41547.1 MAG: rhomboid family intramembrane serine protease [Microcystis aeruginosa Ma_QC_Ca_00000000_S207]MCA2621987.1 rhomboid family intramembrane se